MSSGSFEVRDFYLRGLSFTGCAACDGPVCQNLISYIEKGENGSLLAGTCLLARIAGVQREFVLERHAGSFVLIRRTRRRPAGRRRKPIQTGKVLV